MGDTQYHWRLALENYQGALSELRAGRYSNVGLLAIKSLEQAIEACAAREGLHFHERPWSAHRNRREWLQQHFPQLIDIWNELWSIYGTLGYEGIDGRNARRAVNLLREALIVLGRECVGEVHI